MDMIRYAVSAMLDLLYPERCALCGCDHRGGHWCPVGPAVDGLRSWDQPHLCRSCLAGLSGEPHHGSIAVAEKSGLPVYAGARTSGDLVQLVGSWKYHGLRGLVWPLSSLLEQTLRAASAACERDVLLIPIPLHRGRRRARGFNQAELLARILAARSRFVFRSDLLQRTRDTGQQAKVTGAEQRTVNMENAFRCAVDPSTGNSARLYLVDDLVTSGATVAAASAALESSGWGW